MAIGVTSRHVELDSAPSSTWTSSSAFTPSSNVLLVFALSARRIDSIDVVDVTSVAWNSISATKISTEIWDNTGTTRRMWQVWALNTGTATSATATCTYGQTLSQCDFQIFEVTGTDVAAGVSQCFIQKVLGGIQNNAGFSLSLNAAENPNNRAFALFNTGSAQALTPRANWTEISDDSTGQAIQWREDTFETTASGTWTSSQCGGIAMEIKASPQASVSRMLTLGAG